jgi:hypothetical protein
MAIELEGCEAAQIAEAHRRLRQVVRDCRELLDRTEAMLRRSRQDNDLPLR